MALLDSYDIVSQESFPLFDRVIDVQFLNKAGLSSSVILTPTHGCKPGIQFQTEMLPGGVATQFKLAIANFTADVDIGEYSHMLVKIGYRTSPIYREFTAAIFSSFIESPNPNGKTIFTGLVGDWFIDGLKETNRTLVFKEPRVTVEELIRKICSALNLPVSIDLPDWVLKDYLNVGQEGQKEARYWTESGYACLNWLIDRMSTYGEIIIDTLIRQGMKQQEAERYRILCVMQDNLLIVSMKGFTKALDKNEVKYVSLDKVTNVSFQGAALNVVAPWNPLVMPGSLFHMQAKFFRGKAASQQLLKEARDSSDLYRVITEYVDYDTNGSTNSMRLLAIKNDAFVSNDSVAQKMTAVEKEMDAKTNVYVSATREPDILFGSDRPIQEGERRDTWGVTPDTMSVPQGLIRPVKAGETLGSIAAEVYGDLVYYKTPAEGNIDHVNDQVPGRYFWPLIAIGNYCMFLKQVAGFSGYTEKPEQLVEGRNVFIPAIVSLDSWTSLHDILVTMADVFESTPDNTWNITPEDIRYMRLITYYMELV